MPRYIDADDFLDLFYVASAGQDKMFVEVVKTVVEDTPIADVAPVIHGRWYDEDSFDAHGSPIYRCSVCNKTVADNYISYHKFCLHCGARMDVTDICVGGNEKGW